MQMIISFRSGGFKQIDWEPGWINILEMCGFHYRELYLLVFYQCCRKKALEKLTNVLGQLCSYIDFAGSLLVAQIVVFAKSFLRCIYFYPEF